MKKIRLIAAICLMAFAAGLSAKEISPTQLKEARMAVYDWVKSYMSCSSLLPQQDRGDRANFLALFENEETSVYNDCFFTNGYDFEHPYVSARNYVDTYFSENPLRPWIKKMGEVKMLEENVSDKECCYRLSIIKTVYAADSMEKYRIPDITVPLEIVLRYNLDRKKAYAVSLNATRLQEAFIVYHQDTVNRICTMDELQMMEDEVSSPFTSSRIVTPAINDKFREVRRDTLKQNFHFSPYVGGAFYTMDWINAGMTNTDARPTLSAGIGLGYYHQYALTRKHRVGMEINVSYLYSTLDYSGAYYTAYSAKDPVGSSYERRIQLDNYKEVIWNHAFYLSFTPIRHDILFCTNNQHWSFYWSLGVFASYTFQQTVHATTDALYSGYYDWLFGVEFVDQVYDFGRHSVDEYTHQTGMGKLNVGLLASLGFQYFIPKTHWSIEPSVRFQSAIYMPLAKEHNFHIIDSSGKWRSASYLFNRMYMQNFGFQLNINYHFK